ncbi:MAG: BlaI/MecI/CopY family transcriptional regulator [Pseudonocardiaceae bacterium]
MAGRNRWAIPGCGLVCRDPDQHQAERRPLEGAQVAGRVTRDHEARTNRGPSRRAAGELEAEVLAALWAADGPLAAAQVRQAVGSELAYNTVQTILVRLFDKGLIDRVADGRRHEYFPVKGAEDLAAEQMQALLSRGRDRQAVLQRFATSLSAEDARVLRAMLRRRR